MRNIILVCCSVFALLGCTKEAVSTNSTNNSEVKVELLFQHEGVKVYRFYDGGRRIYYTDARGKVEYNTGGKNNVTHSIETVE